MKRLLQIGGGRTLPCPWAQYSTILEEIKQAQAEIQVFDAKFKAKTTTAAAEIADLKLLIVPLQKQIKELSGAGMYPSIPVVEAAIGIHQKNIDQISATLKKEESDFYNVRVELGTPALFSVLRLDVKNVPELPVSAKNIILEKADIEDGKLSAAAERQLKDSGLDNCEQIITNINNDFLRVKKAIELCDAESKRLAASPSDYDQDDLIEAQAILTGVKAILTNVNNVNPASRLKQAAFVVSQTAQQEKPGFFRRLYDFLSGENRTYRALTGRSYEVAQETAQKFKDAIANIQLPAPRPAPGAPSGEQDNSGSKPSNSPP